MTFIRRNCPRAICLRNRAIRQRAASLIEVLVAIVVVGIGLLGIAGLQMRSVQSSADSYYLTLATIRATDFGERLWAAACILSDADERLQAASNIRDQWLAAHYRNEDEDELDLEERERRSPIRFIDPESLNLPEEDWRFVEPGTTGNEYAFRIRWIRRDATVNSGFVFDRFVYSVVLPSELYFRSRGNCP